MFKKMKNILTEIILMSVLILFTSLWMIGIASISSGFPSGGITVPTMIKVTLVISGTFWLLVFGREALKKTESY